VAGAHLRRVGLVALAAGAPLVFTGSWLLLGALQDGYSQGADTISAVAAVGAPYAGAMVAAFVVQGLGQLAGAALARAEPTAPWVAGWLAVGGVGTLLAGAVRLPDDGGNPLLATGHALAATAAFGGLHLAVLAGALSRAVPRWLRVSAVAALVVAVPHLVWFVTKLGQDEPLFGYAEKVFTTVLLAWCAALALGRTPTGTAAAAVTASSAAEPR
jgi:hypothetical protein